MTSFKAAFLLKNPANSAESLGRPACGGGGWYLHPRMVVNRASVPFSPYEAHRYLVDPGRRDPDPCRPGADGRGERPGIPAAGPALRRGPRLLGDGLLRRNRAPERADARVPPGRRRRASARDPDLRLGAPGHGGGGPDGRGG